MMRNLTSPLTPDQRWELLKYKKELHALKGTSLLPAFFDTSTEDCSSSLASLSRRLKLDQQDPHFIWLFCPQWTNEDRQIYKVIARINIMLNKQPLNLKILPKRAPILLESAAV